MTATAEDADRAMSNVTKEESDGGVFLKVIITEDEEVEDAPLSTPFVTGLIKQEEAPAATEPGTDSEAPAPSDLKNETPGGISQEMKEGKEDEYVEAVGVKDGGMELPNELGGISGMEFETEGEIVKEDSLDVVSGGDEETKPVSSCDVSECQMKHILERVSTEEKGLDDGTDDVDGPPPGWEDKVVPDEEVPVALASVGNFPLEIKMEEVWSKEDKLGAPELENDDDDDGPSPGRDSMFIKEEVKAVTRAPVESILFELKTEDVRATKDTLPSPCLENDDDADGPPPGWEATVIKDEVESVPPASVESIQFETKMEEVRSTEDTLSAPGLENDADGPPPGWKATVIKDEHKPLPPSVESIQLETKMEEIRSTEDTLSAPGFENDDDADGPPSGWEATVIKDEVKSVSPASIESSQLVIQTEEELPAKDKLSAPGLENDVDDHGPPPGWKAADSKESVVEEELVKLEKGKDNAQHDQKEEQRPHRMESEGHTAPRPSLPCEASSPTTEMGQVVCGSCRSLLSYPNGAKYVQCVCCQTVSLVLEADQIGQVYCGGCSMLLMYRFGSRAVKCSGCKFITQITPHNQRPPLSEQGVTLQSQLAQLRPRPTTNLAQ